LGWLEGVFDVPGEWHLLFGSLSRKKPPKPDSTNRAACKTNIPASKSLAAVEGRVEVDDVLAEDAEVVAVMELVLLHCAPF
jgi:hypothetical protein